MAEEVRAAAAAATVAPILQLKDAACAANDLSRFARACELFERALRAAEDALPTDSLINAALCVEFTMNRAAGEAENISGSERHPRKAAWLRDVRSLAMSQRALRICHARWRAGTLLTVTPEERAYFCGDGDTGDCAPPGVHAYVVCARDAACLWPPLRDAEEERERVRGVYGALQTALQTVVRDGQQLQVLANYALLELLLEFYIDVDAAAAGLLSALMSDCGLTGADIEALQAWVLRRDVQHEAEKLSKRNTDNAASARARAAADVARYGLRVCALPECGATEPQPKAFKVCGRCNAVVYCSAVHQQADWRRHKRSDGCKAPPPPP
jgi:hypothetical protein